MDPMIQNIILPQIGLAQDKIKNNARQGDHCVLETPYRECIYEGSCEGERKDGVGNEARKSSGGSAAASFEIIARERVVGVQLELGDDESARCSLSDTTVPYSLQRSVASALLTRGDAAVFCARHGLR